MHPDIFFFPYLWNSTQKSCRPTRSAAAFLHEFGQGGLFIQGPGLFSHRQALGGKSTSENKKKPTPKTWSWTIKSLGVSIKITRAQVANDIDKAPAIKVKESLYLGVALSIDSFGAGISSAVAGVNSFLVPVLVGLCQFVFLSLGLYCGSKLTAIQKLNSNFFMLLSGTILITLACVRYFL